jgi:hypothetical protein
LYWIFHYKESFHQCWCGGLWVTDILRVQFEGGGEGEQDNGGGEGPNPQEAWLGKMLLNSLQTSYKILFPDGGFVFFRKSFLLHVASCRFLSLLIASYRLPRESLCPSSFLFVASWGSRKRLAKAGSLNNEDLQIASKEGEGNAAKATRYISKYVHSFPIVHTSAMCTTILVALTPLCISSIASCTARRPPCLTRCGGAGRKLPSASAAGRYLWKGKGREKKREVSERIGKSK